FIPYPVVTGFTSGIAVIIFSSQIKDLLGLRMGTVPADFVEKWAAIASSIGTFNGQAVGVAAFTITIITLWPRVSRKVPGPFVALIGATVLAWALDLPVETIGSRFGALTSALPHPSFPHVTL